MNDTEIITKLNSLLDDDTVMVYLNDYPLRSSDIKLNKRGRIWFDGKVFAPACANSGIYITISDFWELITVYHRGDPMKIDGKELTLNQRIREFIATHIDELKEIE